MLSSPHSAATRWSRRGCLRRVPPGPLNSAWGGRGGGDKEAGGGGSGQSSRCLCRPGRGTRGDPCPGLTQSPSAARLRAGPGAFASRGRVAGSGVKGRGGRSGHLAWDSRSPPAPPWNAVVSRGAGGVKARLLAPASPLVGPRSAAPRGSGAREQPRRGSGGRGARVREAAGSLPLGRCVPSRWARASDRPASGVAPSPREGTLSPATPGLPGGGEPSRGEGRAGPKPVFGVCCRGFPGAELGLRRPLPQGFVLTGNCCWSGEAAGGRGYACLCLAGGR